MAEESRIFCRLPVDDASRQLNEWHDLADAVLATEEVANGVELVLPARLTGAAENLAAREAACCAFLQLQVTEDGEVARLRITSDTPGADHVIALLIGAAP